jgi:hypothetical protein
MKTGCQGEYFDLKRKEVVGIWRRPHNKKLWNFNTSLIIIWVIKSRRMRWAWHVAHMRAMRNAYSILVGKPEG